MSSCPTDQEDRGTTPAMNVCTPVWSSRTRHASGNTSLWLCGHTGIAWECLRARTIWPAVLTPHCPVINILSYLSVQLHCTERYYSPCWNLSINAASSDTGSPGIFFQIFCIFLPTSCMSKISQSINQLINQASKQSIKINMCFKARLKKKTGSLGASLTSRGSTF